VTRNRTRRIITDFKVEFRIVVIHNVIYYHLSYTVSYTTFRLAVCPTCLEGMRNTTKYLRIASRNSSRAAPKYKSRPLLLDQDAGSSCIKYRCPGRSIFRTVSEIELFYCTVPKLLITKRYYVLFPIPIFIVEVTKLVQFTKYNTLSKIPQSTSMHFATHVRTWRVACLYSEIAVSRKAFGIGHMYIYSFLLRMTDTVTSQNIDISSWDTCITFLGIENVVFEINYIAPHFRIETGERRNVANRMLSFKSNNWHSKFPCGCRTRVL
jgi:hypothetical protein